MLRNHLISFKISFGRALFCCNYWLSIFCKATVNEIKERVMELMARYEVRRTTLLEELAKLAAPLKNSTKVTITKYISQTNCQWCGGKVTQVNAYNKLNYGIY